MLLITQVPAVVPAVAFPTLVEASAVIAPEVVVAGADCDKSKKP